jgi:ABC-type phosphate transport system substrate-binding protein
MRSRLRIGLALVCLSMVFNPAVGASGSIPKVGYRVICNVNNPIDWVDRQFLEDVFLKKVRSWPGDRTIRPVDLEPRSPVRRQFTDEVLRRSVDSIRVYWQQRIFAGRELPPPEVETDEEVIQFVLRDRGAIGYVSGGITIEGAKVLAVK